MYDCHVHTFFSYDGQATLQEQCARARERKLSGITVTEHNYPTPKGFSHAEHIRALMDEAKRLGDACGDDLEVLCGVELADLFLDGCDNAPFCAMQDVDCLLGSVHSKALFRKHFPDAPIRTLMGNGANITLDFAKRVVEVYFLEVLQTAQYADVDVIAHLTYPFRYISGEGNMCLELSEFYPMLDEIFATMIKRGLSLEVNTSGFARGWMEYMPPKELLTRYYDLGGRYITTGSDAHKAEQLAIGIPEAETLLKSIGFTHGVFYRNRQRQLYQL